MRQPVALLGFALAAVLAGLPPARAQEGTGCAAFKWPIDREQSGFSGEGIPTIKAGAQIPGIMEAVTLKLARQDGQNFDPPPTHQPKHDPAYAGAFQIPPIEIAGPYNVTISGEAWIDLIQNGKALHQTGFTGAKDCHDVRKSVRFDFAQGPATIMITDAATDTLKLELVPPAP